MLRNILSVIIGLILSFIFILIGESIIHSQLVSLPQNLDINNMEMIRKFIRNAPASFHIFLLINYSIATFIASICSSLIASTKKMTKAITVGGILTGMGIYNLVTAGHPGWVIICGLFAFLPFAYLGGLMGIKISSKKK